MGSLDQGLLLLAGFFRHLAVRWRWPPRPECLAPMVCNQKSGSLWNPVLLSHRTFPAGGAHYVISVKSTGWLDVAKARESVLVHDLENDIGILVTVIE